LTSSAAPPAAAAPPPAAGAAAPPPEPTLERRSFTSLPSRACNAKMSQSVNLFVSIPVVRS
jgi:hypothetical protein